MSPKRAKPVVPEPVVPEPVVPGTAAAQGAFSSPMAGALKASDLWPLVSKLSPDEQRRLAALALRAARAATAADGARYAALPPGPDELSSDDELLGWDAEGWDDLDAKG